MNCAVKRRAFLRATLAALLCLAVQACGYQLLRHSGPPARVALHGFRNDTFEPGVAALVTDGFAREFLRSAALRLVENPAQADFVVAGAVRALETSESGYSSVALALEYEVQMELAVSITRRGGARLPLGESALRESERYLASADVEVARNNRSEALRRLAGLLAARVHDALRLRELP